MLQVKEFLNYREAQDDMINKWFKEMDGKISDVTIKYSVCYFTDDNGRAQEFSGVLIIYKTI